MTIRRQWMIALGIMAVTAIAINGIVLGLLTSRSFSGYLQDSYDLNVKQITDVLEKNMVKPSYTEGSLDQILEGYLDNGILEIKVYNGDGAVMEDVTLKSGMGMGNMHGMMGNGSSQVKSYDLTHNGTTIGTFHLFLSSSVENSYAASVFRKTILLNTLISLGILMIPVALFGYVMGRKMSRQLVRTAALAQTIETVEPGDIVLSGTKEIRTIEQSLLHLSSSLRLKQTARKTLVDEMMHQTRTPLTILKTHMEGLSDGVLEISPEEVAICESQVDNLSGILANIGSLIESEQPDKKPVLQKEDITEILDQIGKGLTAQFEKKQIAFLMEIQPQMVYRVDRYGLSQAVYNLLTNSIKYTEPGGTVWLQGNLSAEGLYITVKDTGCGIAEEQKDRVFEAYFRGTTEGEGEGLGLYVARENIRGMGGDIRLASEKNKGSTFVIVL